MLSPDALLALRERRPAPHPRAARGAVLSSLVVTATLGTASVHAQAVASFRFPTINPFGLVEPGELYLVPEPVDLDGDGDLDLIVAAGEKTTDVSFYENVGSPSEPSFAAPQDGAFGITDTDGQRSSLASADVDDDGDADVFVFGQDGDVTFYRNVGSATAPSFAAQTPPSGLGSLPDEDPVGTFVDLDGDGDLDLFTGRTQGGFRYYPNTGTPSNPSFGFGSENPFGLFVGDDDSGSAPTFADLDGDGDLDLLAGIFRGANKLEEGYFYYYRNVGTAGAPSFAAREREPFGITTEEGAIRPYGRFGDFNGDGNPDLLQAFNDFVYQKNGGDGYVANPFELERPYGSEPTFGDLDGDGHIDILTILATQFEPRSSSAHGDQPVAVFLRNEGTASEPSYGEPVLNPFGLDDVLGTDGALKAADLDGDGDLDLTGLTSDPPTGDAVVRFYENTGSTTSPSFADPVLNPFGLTPWAPSAGIAFDYGYAVGDLDGDGDLDLLLHATDVFFTAPALFAWYENTGTTTTPAFAGPMENPPGLAEGLPGANAHLELYDIDEDGDADLLGTSAEVGAPVEIRVFRNDASGGTPGFIEPALNPGAFGHDPTTTPVIVPMLADIDDDGVPEFMGGTSRDAFIYLDIDGFFPTPIENEAPAPVYGVAAEAEGRRAVVTWQTRGETESAGFEVQRALGDGLYVPLGYVPGAGTTSETRTYRFRSEPLPDGVYRLRVKHLRFDGGFAYSPEVEVVVGNPVLHTLGQPRPNPTRAAAHVELRLERAQQVRAVLYDALGRRVAVLHDGPVTANAPLDLVAETDGLAPGLYVLRVLGETFTDARSITVLSR